LIWDSKAVAAFNFFRVFLDRGQRSAEVGRAGAGVMAGSPVVSQNVVRVVCGAG